MANKNLTRPDHIHAFKRRKFVLDLRASGVTYEDIVEAVKLQFPDAPPSYDVRYAWRDVMKSLALYNKELMESAENTRTIMLKQIDTVMITVYQMAQSGNLKAVDRFVRLLDQKAKLVGAYAPAHVKITDWRSEILQLMQERKIDPDQVRDYLGEQLYRELVEQRGTPRLEAGEIEEGNFIEVEE